MNTNKIKKDWIPFFNGNKEILDKIWEEISKNKFYPKNKNIFKVFEYLAPQDIKLVMLGQDPYIGGEYVDNKFVPQAQGLSFSVPKTHKIPPSLNNIFKEIKNDYPDKKFKHGNLKKWVKKEKIFLLNTSLSVIPKKSNSHQKYWIEFTDKVIKYINDINNNVIFLMMGKFAQTKNKLIDENKHYIINVSHPSPFSAHRGFFDSHVFKKINTILKDNNKEIINW
jgi:uracil-DNA glycosylase